MASGRLRLGFQVWGQYVSWSELMAIGREIDELGFDELWSNDHLLPQAAGGAVDGRSTARSSRAGRPCSDGRAITRQARMGCLVSGAAYRNPGLLVKMATALDHATGGRAVLGLGAGWFELEHEAFGFEFPPVGRRLDRLGDGGGDQPRAARRVGRDPRGRLVQRGRRPERPTAAPAAAADRDRRERGEADAPDRRRIRRHLERRPGRPRVVPPAERHPRRALSGGRSRARVDRADRGPRRRPASARRGRRPSRR